MGLTNDIISFLFTFRKMNLPGLGLLELIKTPAKRNVAKNKIIGPEFHIEFHDNRYDKNIFSDFISFIASKYEISTRKAENEIQKYSVDLLNSIANFGSASIENLGTFSRKNDKLHFELSPVLTEIIKESYPDYSTPYIKRKQKESIVPPDAATSFERKKTSSDRNWIFPFIILTISSIIILCMIYCFSDLLRNDTDKQIVSDTSKITVDNTISQDTSAEFPFEEETDTSAKSQTIPSIDSSNTIKTGNTDQNIDTIPKKISLEELIKMAPEMRKKYEKTCIIITGSFIKKYNARRMIKRLEKDGFTPYSERYGRFHRTGVLFDCNKKPLRAFLKELRQSVEKDSWVLKWK